MLSKHQRDTKAKVRSRVLLEMGELLGKGEHKDKEPPCSCQRAGTEVTDQVQSTEYHPCSCHNIKETSKDLVAVRILIIHHGSE